MSKTTEEMTDRVSDQMHQFTDLQQRSLEPMRAFGAFAAEAFEQMTRKNYALVGDMVDYSIRQYSLAVSSENVNEALSAQMEESKAFAELMSRRTSEYAELVGNLGGTLRQSGQYAASTLKNA